MYKSVSECRVCKSSSLTEFFSLGTQPLSGVFLKDKNESVSSGPLRLLWCSNCTLVQLGESFLSTEMYGDGYGYRSGLNPTMVGHLRSIAKRLVRRLNLDSEDIVLDIGSNDGTFLNILSDFGIKTVGSDPTSSKYRELYNPEILLIEDFFDSNKYFSTINKKASLVTSIAMFYDLEDPVTFASEVNNVLESNGHWFFEQSYAPWMQANGAYDTVCHEHLEYYSLTTIKEVLDRSGFAIVEVTTNAINGGSIGVLAQKKSKAEVTTDPHALWLLSEEDTKQLNSLEKWTKFSENVMERKESLLSLLNEILESGKIIYGLGASTKGNVLLSYSGIDSTIIPKIGEINPFKYDKFTPGSQIQIVPESEVLKEAPDFLLFLPWHFRNFALEKYSDYLNNGGRLILPLPVVEVIGI